MAEGGHDPRKTSRPNAGVPPSRFGGDEWDYRPSEDDSHLESQRPPWQFSPPSSTPKDAKTPLALQKVPPPPYHQKTAPVGSASLFNSKKFGSSTSIKSNASQIKKDLLKVDIEAQKELDRLAEAEAQIEKESIARKRNILKMESDYKRAEIDEQFFGWESDEEDQKLPPPTVQKTGYENYTELIQHRNEDRQRIFDAYGGEYNYQPSVHSHSSEDMKKEQSVCGSLKEDSLDKMDKLLDVMTNAFSRMNTAPPATNSTDKFLARQSHAKELPFFSGKPEEWPMFLSAYQRTTDICGYTDSENISRLQKCLKGDALKMVQCLMVSPENLKSVMAKLAMRFGRPEHIIKAMILKVEQASPVKDDKFESLIEFGISVDNLTSTIKALKCIEHLNNPMLLDKLRDKLSPHYQFKWMEWVTANEDWKQDLTFFSKWLTSAIEIACALCPYKHVDSESNRDKKFVEKRTNQATVYSTTTIERKPPEEPPVKKLLCLHCGVPGHTVEICRKFKSEDSELKWGKVKEWRLCFCCLKPGHSVSECPTKKVCGKEDCQKFHHVNLHVEKSQNNHQVNQRQTCGSINQTSSGRLLRIAPVVLNGPKGDINTYAIFDDCSKITMLISKVDEELGLHGKEQPLCIQWFNEHTRKEEKSRNVSLTIKGDFEQAPSFNLTDVRTVSDIRIPPQSINVEELKKKWPHLRKLQMKSMKNVVPTILIGIDNAKLTAHREILEGPDNAPIATRTKLGWVVGGRTGNSPNQSAQSFHICEKTESDSDLHHLVKNFFSTESFGIKVMEGKPTSRNDSKAIAIMEATTKRVEDNRWGTGLLWRSEEVKLPDSSSNASSRLKCQERRMDRDPEFARQYCEKMDEYLAKGFISKLNKEDKPCDFKSNSRWLQGPEFLRLPESEWPQERREQTEEVCEDDLELKIVIATAVIQEYITYPLPEITRFSSWLKLIRTTAVVRRGAYNWQRSIKRSEKKINVLGDRFCGVLVKDLKEAENQWIRKAQEDTYEEDIGNLRNGDALVKKSKLWKLKPFLDEQGFFRVEGRIGNAPDASYDMQHPLIIDPKRPYTKLLIDYFHTEGAHQGQERVVNDLRKRFWITDIRTAVRSAWNRCQECRNKTAKPLNPEMGILPISRLQSGKQPFASTGVDYFGPLSVTIGRRHEKRWGVVFTCMSTRAIHLEVAPSLDTDQMLMALMRFVNRRGQPDHIHSDNGTNFRGADTELRQCLQGFDQSRLTTCLSNKGIQWHFIPPAAPHMGGVWERMVGMVKKTLSRLLKERSPKEYTLLTLFTEVENIVNSRPLTHVSVDPEDPTSLTPNHFLRMNSFVGPSLAGDYEDSDIILRKQWRMAQRLADHFWARWVTEYLPSLNKREKWHATTIPIKVGDVVLVVDDQLPRNCWMKGIIMEVFPGKDGIVRTVEVKTVTGTYRRPVVKICPLGIRSG